MYVTRTQQSKLVQISALVCVSLLLVSIGFGIALGVRFGFFRAASHPTLQLEPPDWVPALGYVARPETYLVTSDQAGPLSLGMLLSVFSREIAPWWFEVVPEVGPDGLTEHYVVHSPSGDVLLEAVPECQDVCRIAQITILSPRFLTRDGLRVGSTYGALRSLHSIRENAPGAGVQLVESDAGIIFAVQDTRSNDVGQISDQAIIEYILLRD